MKQKLWFASVAALCTILLAVPQVAAHGYSVAGIAERGDEKFRLFISRSADLANGTAQYGVTITDLQLNVVEAKIFWADDNYLQDENLPSPTYVNGELHAESVTSGVDFVLDGIQVNLAVQGSGHYEDYAFTVTTSFVG